MKRKGHEATVVGFYRDHGKTKPITKSTADIHRKRVVKEGREFKGIGPKMSLSERLESLIEELQMIENNVKILTEQKKQLVEQGLEVSAVDRELQEAKAQTVLIKNKIRHLR